MRTNAGLGRFRSSVMAAAVALLAFGGAAQAASVSWVGGSGNWLDRTHWSTGSVPVNFDDISLNTGTPGAVTVVSASRSFSPMFYNTGIGDLTVGANNRFNIDIITLWVYGNIANDGDLIVGVPGPDTSGTLQIQQNTSLSGTGTVALTGFGILALNRHTLTVGSGQTLRAAAMPGYTRAGAITEGNIINQGLLTVDSGTLLTGDLAGSWIDNSAGRISVGSTGVLLVGLSAVTGGRIEVTSGGAIAGSSAGSHTAFTNVTFEGTATLRGGTALVNATNKGTLHLADTELGGTIVNNGVIDTDFYGGQIGIQSNTTITGNGTVALKQVSPSPPSLTLAATTTLTIDNGQTVRGAGTVRGNGGNRIVNHGVLFVEGGRLDFSTGAAGILDNSAGRIDMWHDGELALASWGLTLGDSSTLAFHAGANATDYGRLTLTSAAPLVLDGTLLLGIGYRAEVGDSFTLISSAAGETGTFDQIIAQGYDISTSYNSNGVVVTITGVWPVPEPASWLLASVGLVVLGRRLRKQA